MANSEAEVPSAEPPSAASASPASGARAGLAEVASGVGAAIGKAGAKGGGALGKALGPVPAAAARTFAAQGAPAAKAALQAPEERSPLGGVLEVLPWQVPAGLAALLLALFAVWWKKRKSAPKKPPAKPAPALDLHADWKAFRRRLPRSMRRVLDELSPVIVLGSNASEKDLFAEQQSRVSDNEQLFPGRVVHRGKGLSAYLGARSLVLVPSDEFLEAPASSEDPSWRRVLCRVARVRAPRVVVCLSQAPLDAGKLDEVTQWTGKLRAHVDVVAAVRNEDVELSVALVQAPNRPNGAAPRLTDALFELLWALGKQEGLSHVLSVPLGGFAERLSPRVEERRESAQRWVAEMLRGCQRGWPRLLAHPEYDAARLLSLAEFFEHFESWSASLGAGLGELLVKDERQTRQVLGQELCFVPCVERRLLGSVAAFSGPREHEAGRWRPTQPLIHRLRVATGTGVLAALLWLCYEHDQSAWDTAATAARRYDPAAGGGELEVVRRYVAAGAAPSGLPLPRFFDRGGVRCVVVESTRRYLKKLIDHAVDAYEAPEDLLQLVGLFAGGTPEGCSLEDDPNYRVYADLSLAIEDHIEQWRHVTALSEEEIAGYLELACPEKRLRLDHLESKYGRGQQGEREWDPVPSVAAFGRQLGTLRGECELSAEERVAVEAAEDTVAALSDIGEHHGAALEMLRTIRKLDTPTMALLTGVFDRYEPRLQAIEDLGDEHEGLQLLARDLRPFADVDGRRAAPEVTSLSELNRQLRAHLSGELPQGEDGTVRLTVAGDTYVIDRQKVRTSLLMRALERLQREFVDDTTERERAAQSQESVFFPVEPNDAFRWLAPAALPGGVHVLPEVPRRYTATAFRENVLGPIETMHELMDAHRCGAGEDTARDEHATRAREFVAARLASYLHAYAETWRAVYDSFSISARSDSELSEILAGLSRPTSPEVALVREVLRQTRLSAAEGWPFRDLLAIASGPFDTLEGVVSDKALSEYQGLLLELANAGQDTLEAGTASWAPASAPARAAASPEEALEVFGAGLSGFGRVVFAGLRDPERDVRRRAQAWAKAIGVAPALSSPLMLPIEEAYARGRESFARGLARYWLDKSRELRADFSERFPFNEDSRVDASVEDLTAWLDPLEGRFGSEVLSLYRLATSCGVEPCVELPPGMRASVEHLIDVQRALFDDNGAPRALVFQLDPVPFESQPLLPKRAVLKIGSSRYEYFNTVPRAMSVRVPWNEAYVAGLSVELLGGPGGDELVSELTTSKSAWAFARLLSAAPSESGGRYTWHLDATLQGSRRGTVSVSYDVCGDVGRCGGLLERVFGWQ